MRVSFSLVLLAALVAIAACTREAPSSPSPVPTAASKTVATWPPPGVTAYDFSRGLTGPAEYFNFSQYVLDDAGTFMLMFSNDVVLKGTFTRTGGGFAFSFTPSTDQPPLVPPGPWNATGTLTGKELTVRYSTEMRNVHFEDAVYTLYEPR